MVRAVDSKVTANVTNMSTYVETRKRMRSNSVNPVKWQRRAKPGNGKV